jgi:hypothetical protein
MKKNIVYIVIVSVIIFIALAVLSYYLYPFFNTGLVINSDPENAYIIIDGQIYEQEKDIKVKAGEHKLTAYANGYLPKEASVQVGKYGKTNYSIKLERSQPLLEDLPYELSLYGKVEGYYDDFGRAVYVIYYASEEEKKELERWLRLKGVDFQKSIINYHQDGD